MNSIRYIACTKGFPVLYISVSLLLWYYYFLVPRKPSELESHHAGQYHANAHTAEDSLCLRGPTLSIDTSLLQCWVNDKTETRAQECAHKVPVLPLPQPWGTWLWPRLLSHRVPQALACRAGQEVDVYMELPGIDLQRYWAVLLPGGSWVERIEISILPDSHCCSFQAVTKVLWVVRVKSTR